MPTTLVTVAGRLVARFRHQRPLRAGSLIVTIFGDSIMPRGGAISLRSLIRVAAPFGLNERLVRTATARLAQEGWLDSRRVGNSSEYRLSAGGRERFAEATVRIYGGPATEWSGRWRLVVLPPMPAAERQTLRRDLTWRGFGEIGNGVFAHPEYPAIERGASAPPGQLAANALVFDAELPDTAAAARLVTLGWDLKVLGKRYRAFVERFEDARAACEVRAPVDPQAAFIVRTLADPRVPPPALARPVAARAVIAPRLARNARRGAVPGCLCVCIRALRKRTCPALRRNWMAGCPHRMLRS